MSWRSTDAPFAVVASDEPPCVSSDPHAVSAIMAATVAGPSRRRQEAIASSEPDALARRCLRHLRFEVAEAHDAEQLQRLAEMTWIAPGELGDSIEAVPDRVGMDMQARRGPADAQVLGDVRVDGVLARRSRGRVEAC